MRGYNSAYTVTMLLVTAPPFDTKDQQPVVLLWLPNKVLFVVSMVSSSLY